MTKSVQRYNHGKFITENTVLVMSFSWLIKVIIGKKGIRIDRKNSFNFPGNSARSIANVQV